MIKCLIARAGQLWGQSSKGMSTLAVGKACSFEDKLCDHAQLCCSVGTQRENSSRNNNNKQGFPAFNPHQSPSEETWAEIHGRGREKNGEAALPLQLGYFFGQQLPESHRQLKKGTLPVSSYFCSLMGMHWKTRQHFFCPQIQTKSLRGKSSGRGGRERIEWEGMLLKWILQFGNPLPTSRHYNSFRLS